MPHLRAILGLPLFAAVLAAALLALPGSARAATALGETNLAASTGTTCPTDVTAIQTGTSAAGPSYRVPAAGGVITSWSYYAASAGDRVRLVLAQPASFAGGYLVMAQSDVMTAVAGLNTFPARVVAHGGDMLGLVDIGSASSCWRDSASPGDQTVSCTMCDVATVPGNLLSPAPFSSRRLNVSAVLEPDADGDGYGDETQDKCLGDVYTATQPCSADVSPTVSAPATITQGGEIDYQVTVTNQGPSIAKGTTVVDPLPPGVTFLSEHSSSTCSGTTTIVCSVPQVNPATSLVGAVIAVSADQPGTVTNTVSLAHPQIPDPNPGNDSASATTTVTVATLTPEQEAALFGGVSIAEQTLVPSAARVVKVRAWCPAPGSVRCRGTLTLTSKGKVTLPRTRSQIRRHQKGSRKVLVLGKATFSIALNKSATIPVRLSSVALAVLKRALSMDTIATAAASDAAAHTKTTTAPVLLVAPDNPKKKRKHRRR